MKKYYFYTLIGLIFGVFDHWFQSNMNFNKFPEIAQIVMIFGVWILSAIPIVLTERKETNSIHKAALAVVYTWTVSLFFYYMGTYVIVVFIGKDTLPFMHISNYQDDYYFQNNLRELLVVFIDTLEWVPISVVGGYITGSILYWIVDIFRFFTGKVFQDNKSF